MTETDQSYTAQDYIDSVMDFDERPPFTCPAYSTYKTPNGKWKTIAMYCKDFRNCEVCQTRRGTMVRARVTTACARAEESGAPWPSWKTMPEAEAPAFRQKLNRCGIEWWRAPVAGSRVIFFYQHDDRIAGGRTVNVQDLALEQGLDWERIALTPLRKRTSGALGRPVDDERPSDAILVELLSATQPTYLTKEQVGMCQMAADEKTADLDPTVDEAVEMCRIVTKALQEELEAAAVEYYIAQGDDQSTAVLLAFRDTPISEIKRYWSPSSFAPWSRHLMSNGKTLDDNRSRYSDRAVPGVDFMPAPVELML